MLIPWILHCEFTVNLVVDLEGAYNVDYDLGGGGAYNVDYDLGGCL